MYILGSICSRRGDWPAVPGKREPCGALQAPGARDHFHPDWRQVIVTWFDSLSCKGRGRGKGRQMVIGHGGGYTHPSFSSHSLDDEVSPPFLSLWRVLFNFTWEYFPSIDRSVETIGLFLIRGNKLLSIKEGEKER